MDFTAGSKGQIQIEHHLPPDFEALMRNPENGISMIGGGTGHNQIHVRLLILTKPIYHRLEPIGTGLIDLRPAIVPI